MRRAMTGIPPPYRHSPRRGRLAIPAGLAAAVAAAAHRRQLAHRLIWERDAARR